MILFDSKKFGLFPVNCVKNAENLKKVLPTDVSIIFDKMYDIHYNGLMPDVIDIEVYSDSNGKEPFNEWIHSLRDRRTKTTILLRIQRLREGNFGDHKIFDKIIELRIH